MMSTVPSNAPKIFAEFENFQCFLVGSDDKIQLKSFLGPAFALEPLNTHLGPEGQRASIQFINFIVEQYANNGYCVAVSNTQNGNIVATLMVLDYFDAHSTELEHFLSTECAILLPIFRLIDTLHDNYFETHARPTKRGQCVEVIATAVEPQFYNKGLLNLMCLHALRNLKSKHDEEVLILLEPTGAFSQAAGIKIGGTKVGEIMYSDYTFNGTKPFETVPKPHDRITLISLPSL